MPAMRPAKMPSKRRRSFLDIGRKLRKVMRETGAIIGIDNGLAQGPCLVSSDPEMDGAVCVIPLGPASKHEYNLKRLHEHIYHERGKEKLRQQGFKCALCGRPLDGTSNTSIDHIESRGAHGRNDRMANIQVCHENPCHRQKHGDRIG